MIDTILPGYTQLTPSGIVRQLLRDADVLLPGRDNDLVVGHIAAGL